jgi:hypothetical protein
MYVLFQEIISRVWAPTTRNPLHWLGSNLIAFDLILLEKVYFANGNDFILYNETITVTIRSGIGLHGLAKRSITTMPTIIEARGWMIAGVYKIPQASLNTILYGVNLMERDAQGAV